jgi:hypothetical protein
MPTQTKKDGTKFNPSLGGAFENSSFGEGSVLLQVTEENLNTIMENIRVGSAILFRFNKVTQKGNKHYFAEILPPMSPKGGAGVGKIAGKVGAKAATASSID